MKLMASIAVLMVLSSQAKADMWSNIGDGMTHLGHEIEHTGAKLGSAASDVITAGEAGRNRDREAANHQKDLDAQAAAGAAAAKKAKIDNLNKEMSEEKAQAKSLADFKAMYAVVMSGFKGRMKAVISLERSVQLNKMNSEALNQMIEDQSTDLTIAVQAIAQKQTADPTSPVNALVQKMQAYLSELKGLSSQTDAEKQTTDLEQAAYETLQAAHELAVAIDAQIKVNETKQAASQAALDGLS